MRIKYKNHEFNLLTKTSTMGCFSFSLPAGKSGSCVMATPGGVCASCYSKINLYNMPTIEKNQWYRFLWTKEMVSENLVAWVEVMSDSIKDAVKNSYFRIHDSGDFYHPDYIWAWYYICKALPDIKFWAPTRVWQSRQINWIAPLRRLSLLPNVSVRPSALNFNELTTSYKFFGAPTAVVDALEASNKLESLLCPKTKNHSSCEAEGCRQCWSKEGNVAYLVHSYMGENKIFKVSDKIEIRRKEAANKYVALTIGNK